MLQEEGGPKLILLASPIGNLEDVSLRLLDTLISIEALACEDTRHSQRLLERHGIPRPRIFFSYHEHNEAKAAERVVGLLREGLDVGLMSDAGTPGLSDPGYRAVTAAIEAGFQVSALPGPNAAIMALTISGLPSDSFTFKGFAPRKQGQRQRFIEEDAGSFHSLVFYESPRRVAEFLEDAATVLGGERQAAVCFELTKLHERVERGSPGREEGRQAGALRLAAGKRRGWERQWLTTACRLIFGYPPSCANVTRTSFPLMYDTRGSARAVRSS